MFQDLPDRAAELAHERLGDHLATTFHAPLPDPSNPVRRPTGENWADPLQALAHQLGLRVLFGVGEADRLLDALTPGRVAVIPTPDGPGWRVIHPLEPGRARVVHLPEDRSEVLDAGAIRVWLTDERPWALLESVLPASALTGRTPSERLRGLLRAEREDVRLVLVYAIAVGLLSLATPAAIQVVINLIAYGALRQPLFALVGVVFACLSLAAGLRGMQRYVVELLERRLFLRLVHDLARRIPRVPVREWDTTYGPELVNRTFDVVTLQKAVGALLIDALSATVQGVVGLTLLAVYHPALLAYDLFLVLGIGGVAWGLSHKAVPTAVKESKVKYDAVAWLQAIAHHATVHKLGGAHRLGETRGDRIVRAWLYARDAHWRVFIRQYASALALQVVATTALLGIGGLLVVEGQMSLGQLVAAEFVVASVLGAFTKFIEKLETAYDALAAADKLGHLADLPVDGERQERHDRYAPLGVVLHDVTFAWPGQNPLFTSLDLTIDPADRLAVVAEGPAGKSTAADLITGLRQPDTGRVTLVLPDGRAVPPAAVREQIALVRDDAVVPGSLYDNVAMGRPIDPAGVQRALRLVGLEGTVARLPDGLDEHLAPSGAPLSDSERVKLAFARAVAGTPGLLVVDGLLDRLGAPDQATLLRSLKADGSPWTLLVFTRRPDLAERSFPSVRTWKTR